MTTERRCLNVALNDLSRRLLSQAELAARLMQAGYEPDIIKTTIERVIELGILSEPMLAQHLARRHENKGDYWIRQKLIQRKLKASIIEETLASLENEWSRAQRVALKKWESDSDIPDVARKAKLFRFLLGRGFQRETCVKAIDRLSQNTFV